MIYPIVLYGNSVLRERAIEIVKGEVDVKKLSEDMSVSYTHLTLPTTLVV